MLKIIYIYQMQNSRSKNPEIWGFDRSPLSFLKGEIISPIV